MQWSSVFFEKAALRTGLRFAEIVETPTVANGKHMTWRILWRRDQR